MKQASPYVAIAALLLTLGGTLYGWASAQGAMKQQIADLVKKVDALQLDQAKTREETMKIIGFLEAQRR